MEITRKLTIPCRLDGLNEYTAQNRRNPYAGAKTKKQNEEVCIMAIKSQLRGIKITKPVRINYKWFEKNKRRDLDNIAFAKKFIQDALVKCQVLKNDGWNEITGFTDDFYVDKNNPRVEVEIREV